MKWFIEKELCCKCCGQLPPYARENMEALVCEVLDPARERLGMPIVVNSGYRCPKHNAAVGGVTNSQHLRGEAADIRLVSGSKFQVSSSTFHVSSLAKAIIENGKFDQLILYANFVHVSWKRQGVNRLQILRKVGNGYVKVEGSELKVEGRKGGKL